MLWIFVLASASSQSFSSAKPKLLWFDATANFARLSRSDSIRYYLGKVAAAGFTDIVVDMKPITGEVLYPSAFAPQMKEWNGFIRPDSLDYLGIFIAEGHARKLRVHASLNIFSGGHNYFDRGVVYSRHPEWASIVYTDSGTMPITSVKSKYSAMTNPADTAIRHHELAVLRELVTRYRVDGVILDRVRYDGICADFSPLSRNMFEEYLHTKIERFPRDIFEWKKDSAGKSTLRRGRYFKEWLEWRAVTITSFIREARKVVKEANTTVSFGDYTGSWYPIYYEVGANWASTRYDPSAEYSWAMPTYKNTGYAELLDLYSSGNYYFEVTKEEAVSTRREATTESGSGGAREYWYSVEGSCEITRKVLMNAVPVFGGLYVEQYRDHPDQFQRAIAMCLSKSDGLMIFDIVHIINYNWWSAVEEGIKKGEN